VIVIVELFCNEINKPHMSQGGFITSYISSIFIYSPAVGVKTFYKTFIFTTYPVSKIFPQNKQLSFKKSTNSELLLDFAINNDSLPLPPYDDRMLFTHPIAYIMFPN
jgi:hypothetical protein